LADGTSTGLDRMAAFAAALRELRANAGNPSFRKMAELSGRVSHTTLHEAATGARFPSWDTTREFALACGGSEADWRDRWERARPGPPRPDSATAIPEPEPPAAVIPEPEIPELAAEIPEPRRKPRTRRYALLAAAGVIVLAAAITIGLRVLPGGRPDSTVSGDAARFVADVTYPDGTIVHPGQHFQKVWEIQNVGSVTWHDRYLRRLDLPPGPNTCQTPDQVPIGETPPGQLAWISVNVTAPAGTGTCWVGWKMVDGGGNLLLPGYRPIYFLVNVTG